MPWELNALVRLCFSLSALLAGSTFFPQENPMKAPLVVERVCRLPIDFRDGTKSPLQLVRDSGYLENPVALTIEAVEDALRRKPELVDEWLGWSEDKRVSSGWYFLKAGTQFVVGYYPRGEKRLYADRIAACADFVIHDVASISDCVV
jgi:hypothetical protein